jgi:hypothetical protein
MKKKYAIRKLNKLLDSWQGSRLGTDTSKEILELLIDDLGMLPPQIEGRDHIAEGYEGDAILLSNYCFWED